MEEFDTLNSREKTIAVLGYRWWSQAAKRKGVIIKKKQCNVRKQRIECPTAVGGVSNRSRNGAPSRKRCVVNGQMTMASNKRVPPSPPRHPRGSYIVLSLLSLEVAIPENKLSH